MIVGIYVDGCEYVNHTYEPRPIEDFGELLHPMAAVAWDRDSEGILAHRALEDKGQFALRFFIWGPGMCNVFTGIIGSTRPMVAEWSQSQEKWIPFRHAIKPMGLIMCSEVEAGL